MRLVFVLHHVVLPILFFLSFIRFISIIAFIGSLHSEWAGGWHGCSVQIVWLGALVACVCWQLPDWPVIPSVGFLTYLHAVPLTALLSRRWNRCNALQPLLSSSSPPPAPCLTLTPPSPSRACGWACWWAMAFKLPSSLISWPPRIGRCRCVLSWRLAASQGHQQGDNRAGVGAVGRAGGRAGSTVVGCSQHHCVHCTLRCNSVAQPLPSIHLPAWLSLHGRQENHAHITCTQVTLASRHDHPLCCAA